MSDLISITELANPRTMNIDEAGPMEIIGLFEKTDEEIFRGYEDYEGFQSLEFSGKWSRAFEIMSRKLEDCRENPGDPLKVVMAGAGTSGRLAMLAAKLFNPFFKKILPNVTIEYLIAGGDLALIKAQEIAEDDPVQGIQDLKGILGDCDNFIYIGITCGMSANYVGGQLNYTVKEKNNPAFMIGFNPLERSRDMKPENWHMSFADVINELKNDPLFVPLNPVVGPEPVTGSTRMKSGTATKMILDSLFYALYHQTARKEYPSALGVSLENGPGEQYMKILKLYGDVKGEVYQLKDKIAPLIERAGEALKNKSHIYYVGQAEAGKLGVVDASECPPTFGADFEDVRGFVHGGWPAFRPDGEDRSSEGDLFNIDDLNFKKNKLPHLKKNDVVVFCGNDQFYLNNASWFHEIDKANKIAIYFGDVSKIDEYPYQLVWNMGFEEMERPIFSSIAIKLIFNSITTGAHILKGKVFKNRMVDLRISNNKLYYRCCRIISELMGVGAEESEQALLKSIFQTDEITNEILSTPISERIKRATDREGIVPAALLLSTGSFTVKEALAELEKEPIVRKAIEKHV